MFLCGDVDGVVCVFCGVFLCVFWGMLFMLFGLNGCGKSMLLWVLVGLVKTDAGAFEAFERKAFVF